MNGTGWTGVSPRIGVDVVDLHRIERIVQDFGASAARILLHPQEALACTDLERDELVLAVAAALGSKEAWVKARLRRPSGWRFPHTRFAAQPDTPHEPEVEAVLRRFRRDLDVDPLVRGVVRTGDDADRAWYGVHDRWLISAVIR